MALPAGLASAIRSGVEGRVAVVIGAGCALEAPTNIPLAKDLALEAHRKLVLDGVIGASDCSNPADLSSVADAVYALKGSQSELVQRLPLDQMRNAAPNDGSRTAAALMRERVIGSVISLNYDLSFDHALAAVSASEVQILERGSGGAPALYALIHLHGDVNSEPDDLVLRSTQLEDDWQDGWEEIVTAKVLASPVVVFAGLGSPADVLVKAVSKIRSVLTDQERYQADPLTYGMSDFTGAIEVDEGHYVQLGWNDLMDCFGAITVEEQVAVLDGAVRTFASGEGLTGEEHEAVLSDLRKLTLVQLGLLRSRWMQESDEYTPSGAVTEAHMADLLHALSFAIRVSGCTLLIRENGLVELRSAGRTRAVVAPVSGRGVRGWLSVEAQLRVQAHTRLPRGEEPLIALVAGVRGSIPQIAPPGDLVGEVPPDDILSGASKMAMISVEKLRENSDVLEEALLP